MTLKEIDDLEYLTIGYECPCCGRTGPHEESCTYSEDCPRDAEILAHQWEQTKLIRRLWEYARDFALARILRQMKEPY